MLIYGQLTTYYLTHKTNLNLVYLVGYTQTNTQNKTNPNKIDYPQGLETTI
jgi:hypothetical protein